jgi:predicted N-acetyltransferase YhbS/methionine aminopeptidase
VIRSSDKADVESIRRLIHATIESSYAGVYPPRAVRHFKEFHSVDRILERQTAGAVLVAEQDGLLVATGSLVGAEISGVFVLPQLQRSGIGGRVMDRLEREAELAGCDSVRLDVSLPSRGFYERRGYRLLESRSMDVGEGERLDYWTAEKPLGTGDGRAHDGMIEEDLAPYRAVQAAAKAALAALAPTVASGDTERELADRAAALLRAQGLHDTWYYDCPALVLLGSRSCPSISGRDYRAGGEAVGETDLVTVDLSPRRRDVCGDYARSLCVEHGRVVEEPQTPEFRRGLEVLASLHQRARAAMAPGMTFAELYEIVITEIDARGFENLDLRANVGHTVAARLDDREFIAAGSRVRLRDAGLFTFEPHIRERGGRWGFKHEDILYLGRDGHVRVL